MRCCWLPPDRTIHTQRCCFLCRLWSMLLSTRLGSASRLHHKSVSGTKICVYNYVAAVVVALNLKCTDECFYSCYLACNSLCAPCCTWLLYCFFRVAICAATSIIARELNSSRNFIATSNSLRAMTVVKCVRREEVFAEARGTNQTLNLSDWSPKFSESLFGHSFPDLDD